jgi:hypothetical protein
MQPHASFAIRSASILRIKALALHRVGIPTLAKSAQGWGILIVMVRRKSKPPGSPHTAKKAALLGAARREAI